MLKIYRKDVQDSVKVLIPDRSASKLYLNWRCQSHWVALYDFLVKASDIFHLGEHDTTMGTSYHACLLITWEFFRCDAEDNCSEVCERGTVKLTKWLQNALKTQVNP